MKIPIKNLRPCDNCGEPIAPVFYVVRVQQAVINYNSLRSHMGLALMFNGNNALADVFNPGSDQGAETLDDDKEYFVCQGCVIENELLRKLVFQDEESDQPTD
jgi:hypothetical protein